MSNSRPSIKASNAESVSNRPFWLLASFVIVLSAGLAASAWPASLSYARNQSDRLSQAGLSADQAGENARGNEAELDFQLAHALNPSNQQAAVHFASQQLSQGDYADTIETLGVVGESASADKLRVQAYLELSQTQNAVSAADHLAGESKDPGDLAIASLAYGVAGKSQALTALVGRLKATVAPSEALQRILRAQAGNLALASELYTSGLLNSSSALLAKQPDSVPRDLMLAQITERTKPKDWAKAAASYYQSAIKLDPTNIIAYQGLIAALDQQKDQAGAKAARQQLKLLQTGQL